MFIRTLSPRGGWYHHDFKITCQNHWRKIEAKHMSRKLASSMVSPWYLSPVTHTHWKTCNLLLFFYRRHPSVWQAWAGTFWIHREGFIQSVPARRPDDGFALHPIPWLERIPHSRHMGYHWAGNALKQLHVNWVPTTLEFYKYVYKHKYGYVCICM